MRTTVFLAVVLCFCVAHNASAQPRDSSSAGIEIDLRPGGATESSLTRLLQQVVLRYMPNSYEDKRDWGQTSERWDGLHVSIDGLRLKTKRRKKVVNHGTWKMYRINLVDPDGWLKARFENGHIERDGSVSFDLVFSAKLHAFGRISKWVKGVQLFSFSADANAVTQMRLNCRLAVAADISRFPPDVVFQPEVKGADLRLVEFKLQRLSNINGPVAEQLGRGLRRVLQDQIDKKRHKLVEKINKQIQKNEDKLRFSLHDELNDAWNEFAAKYTSTGR